MREHPTGGRGREGAQAGQRSQAVRLLRDLRHLRAQCRARIPGRWVGGWVFRTVNSRMGFMNEGYYMNGWKDYWSPTTRPAPPTGSLSSAYSRTVTCRMDFYEWELFDGWMERITDRLLRDLRHLRAQCRARIPGRWVGGGILWMKVIGWMGGRIKNRVPLSGARIPGWSVVGFEQDFYEWEWVDEWVEWLHIDCPTTSTWLLPPQPTQQKWMAAILPSLLVFFLSVWQGEGWLCLWGKELNTVQGHKRLFLSRIPVIILGKGGRSANKFRKSQIREFADFDIFALP